MKSEELFDDLAGGSFGQVEESYDLSRRQTAADAIVRALIGFFSFALLGTLAVAILSQRQGAGEPIGSFEFFSINFLCGSGGLIILWVISGCGFNPFRDSRITSLERYAADTRSKLDSAELTIGAAQGIRAYLDILEQGARNIRRGGFDKTSVEALLKLQSECAAELRSVLNDIIAPLPKDASVPVHTSSVRDVANLVQRLGAFLLTDRRLSLKCEVDQGIQSSRLDSRIASPVILAALRESIKSAESRSVLHLSLKESGSFKNRLCIKLSWQARGFSGTDTVLSIDSLGLNALLRPLHGSLAVQNLSGSRRVLELSIPLVVRTQPLRIHNGKAAAAFDRNAA